MSPWFVIGAIVLAAVIVGLAWHAEPLPAPGDEEK